MATEDEDKTFQVVASITFDPMGDDGPTWFCAVGRHDYDPFVQGDGPTPLAAALQAAEQATALWTKLRFPDLDPTVIVTTYGMKRLDESGRYVSAS